MTHVVHCSTCTCSNERCPSEDSQRFVISDEHTYCFGHGSTLEAAVEDFKVACAERCAILKETH